MNPKNATEVEKLITHLKKLQVQQSNLDKCEVVELRFCDNKSNTDYARHKVTVGGDMLRRLKANFQTEIQVQINSIENQLRDL